jgi:hypothetical protein
MIRTVLIPNNNDVHLSIPDNYVGRKIEVMCYPVDESIEENENQLTKSMVSFKGILSAGEADQLQEYVKKSREEWERFLMDSNVVIDYLGNRLHCISINGTIYPSNYFIKATKPN